MCYIVHIVIVIISLNNTLRLNPYIIQYHYFFTNKVGN